MNAGMRVKRDYTVHFSSQLAHMRITPAEVLQKN